MYTPKPYNESYLPEQDGHQIYFAEYGNPEGETIVSLHGGPGGRSKSKRAQVFDLSRYRVILFDQRGCGKSTPGGKTDFNTTNDLVCDMERLRELLGIDRWFVSGSSWGSTLALVYAQMHPERVRGLLLSSLFLADAANLTWSFYGASGIANIFPDVWKQRLKMLEHYDATPETAAAILADRLAVADEAEARSIVADVLSWEFNLFTSSTDVRYLTPEEVSEEDITYVKVFLHYERDRFFLSENQILNRKDALLSVPMVVVHGRHDILCPFVGAWQLMEALPHAELVALPQSNHALTADGEIARKYVFKAFLINHAS